MQAAPEKLGLTMALDPADAARIRRHIEKIGGGKPARQSRVSVYFDTPDLRLQQNGLSLRLRRDGRQTVQCIEAANGAASAAAGSVIAESTIRGLRPDLASVPQDSLPTSLAEIETEGLRPVFATRIRRSRYQVGMDGCTVALTLDNGDIDTGPDRATISELQFDLMEGEPAGLFGLARTLGEVAPLRLMVQSRVERGSALVEGEPYPIERATDVLLDPEMTCEAGFRAIARNCLRHILANEAAVRQGAPEAVHQMRVGLRRLRAAFTVFSEITADDRRDQLKQELKWIAGTLGSARDLDVLLAEVLEPMSKEHAEQPAFENICRDFQGRRARAYEHAHEAVSSPRYRRLLLDMMEWVECGPWSSNDDALLRVRREQPVVALALDELSRRYRKLIKSGKRMRENSPEERHHLRIRGKKLRYAIEFLANVFPGKRSRRRREEALEALRDLQESLGRLNDIETRERLAMRIVEEDDAPPGAARARAFAAGVIVGREQARREALLDAAEHAYADLAAVKAFWA